MKEEDVRFYQAIRARIEHEDGLTVNRLSWLVGSQSFLFTAYALTLNGLAAGREGPMADRQALLCRHHRADLRRAHRQRPRARLAARAAARAGRRRDAAGSAHRALAGQHRPPRPARPARAADRVPDHLARVTGDRRWLVMAQAGDQLLITPCHPRGAERPGPCGPFRRPWKLSTFSGRFRGLPDWHPGCVWNPADRLFPIKANQS